MTGLERRGEDVLADAPGAVGDTWARQWRFLIWTWTIRRGRRYWLVESVQRRFLGQEVVRRYSKTLWMVSVLATLVAAAALLVVFALVLHRVSGDASVDFSLAAFIGLMFAPYILFSAALAYFTFVPPKEYRSSRKS